VFARFYPVEESIACGGSTALFSPIPTPLPTIYLTGRHLTKTRGGKKGANKANDPVLCFPSAGRVIAESNALSEAVQTVG